MFFDTAYKAAKLGFNENNPKGSDQINRKAWQDTGRTGFFPTDALPNYVNEQDRKSCDWIIVPAVDDAKNHSRIHRNIKMVLGRDTSQGDKAKQLVDEISAWHKETFKNATLEGQMAKLSEEELEYQENLKVSEIADIIIVACGLRNFNSVVGTVLVRHFLDSCYAHRPFFGRNSVAVLHAVQDKMKVNYDRTAKGMWKDMGDGRSHH